MKRREGDEISLVIWSDFKESMTDLFYMNRT